MKKSRKKVMFLDWFIPFSTPGCSRTDGCTVVHLWMSSGLPVATKFPAKHVLGFAEGTWKKNKYIYDYSPERIHPYGKY